MCYVYKMIYRAFWSPLFGMVVDRFGVSWMKGVTA